MPAPRAYLLTWTCYGPWLHGDDRGSVDVEHNVPKTPYLAPDSARKAQCRQRQRGRAATLGAKARIVVARTIMDHCAHRGWRLLAVNVRSNHVHVVLDCGDIAPEAALGQLKAWGTRRLRESALFGADQPVWTQHGSTRHLWNQTAVDHAVKYVTEWQGEDLP